MALVNKYDVYNKIIKVINSCKTVRQCFVARNMINNFNKICTDEILYTNLIIKWRIKLKEV